MRTRREERVMAYDFHSKVAHMIDGLDLKADGARALYLDRVNALINENSIKDLVSVYCGAIDLALSINIMAKALTKSIRARAAKSPEEYAELMALLDETEECE